MTALGAPADLGASRCPSDPGGHLSRAATAPTREYLEGRTLPVQRSPRTLALARAARAGTHPGLSPSTHMFSHTHSLESTRLCDRMGTWLTQVRDQAPKQTIPCPLWQNSPSPGPNTAHPYSLRGNTLYSQSLFP